MKFGACFEVLYPFWLDELLRSIIACPWLPFVTPRNYSLRQWFYNNNPYESASENFHSLIILNFGVTTSQKVYLIRYTKFLFNFGLIIGIINYSEEREINWRQDYQRRMQNLYFTLNVPLVINTWWLFMIMKTLSTLHIGITGLSNTEANLCIGSFKSNNSTYSLHNAL